MSAFLRVYQAREHRVVLVWRALIKVNYLKLLYEARKAASSLIKFAARLGL